MKRIALILVPIILIGVYAFRIAENPGVGSVRTYTDDQGGFVQVEHGDGKVGYVLLSQLGEPKARIAHSVSSGWGVVASELTVDTGKQPTRIRMTRVAKIIQITGEGDVLCESRPIPVGSVHQLFNQLDQARGVGALKIAAEWVGQPAGCTGRGGPAQFTFRRSLAPRQ